MQKKVYLNELSLNRVLERLKKGDNIYDDIEQRYITLLNGVLTEVECNSHKIIYYNVHLYLQSRSHYFLDEVEEPEADESCIGKLCKFWNNDDFSIVGILLEISCGEFCLNTAKGWYKHCRPLTKEEALALVKE